MGGDNNTRRGWTLDAAAASLDAAVAAAASLDAAVATADSLDAAVATATAAAAHHTKNVRLPLYEEEHIPDIEYLFGTTGFCNNFVLFVLFWEAEPVQSIFVYHIDRWRSSKRNFDKGMHKRFQQQMLNPTIFVCLVRDFHGGT